MHEQRRYPWSGIGNAATSNGGGGGGGSGGGDGGNADFNGGGGGGGGGTGATVGAKITSDDTNLLAGTHIGYNWQWRHTVLGVEGDYSANDNLDDYLASLRGRLGWATGNYLLYGTAGVAFAGRGGNDDAIGVAGAGGAGGNGGAGANGIGGDGGNGGPGGITRFGDRDDDETGFVAGGGIEAMLSPMAIVGLEALYYMIDGDNRNGNTGDDDFLALRARLSAHLGGGAFSTAPTANWAGLYVGGNIGALFNQNDKIAGVQLAGGGAGGNGGRHTANFNGGGGGGGAGGGAAAFATLEDDSSVVGGAHAGFNWQNGHWVHGVEGDIGAVEETYEYVASLRGRLGWAYEQVLLYATAGVAFAKDDSFNGTVFVGGGDGDNGASDANGGSGGAGGAGGGALVTNNGGGNDVETGLVIGAGTDVKLSHSLSLGMEGMYYFFDDGGDGPTINASTGNSVDSLDDDTEFAAVRARLTFHFQSQPTTPLK